MIARVSLFSFLAILAACVPETNLAQRSPPAATPQTGLVDPEDGATDVAFNLRTLVVRLGEVQPATPASTSGSSPTEGVLVLRDGGGHTLTLEPPDAIDCADGTVGCLRASVPQPLAAATRYVVAFGSRTLGGFTTAQAPDTTPPMVSLATLTVDDCIGVQLQADEPVSAQIRFWTEDAAQTLDSGAPRPAVDIDTRLSMLPPATQAHWSAHVTDAAGNATDTPTQDWTTPPATPFVAITEVLANPAGNENTQEFVEILNLEPVTVDLGGFLFQDSSGRDVLPPASLGPGARALLVAAAYNENDTSDPQPPPDVLLIRVTGKLGGDGLTNAGEPLALRTADGALVSSYGAHGGWPDTSAKAWNGRSTHRDPETACDRPSAWSQTPALPTPGR